MKYRILLLTPILFFSCKKEEITTPVNTKTNTPPSITLTLPLDSNIVELGETFKIEGLAIDSEGLEKIKYEIESPSASYNYISTGEFSISGLNTNFSNEILIPETASVGNAKVTVYSIDNEGGLSEKITRTIKIKDEISPESSKTTDYISNLDTIRLYPYLNNNNIVDSIMIYNQTEKMLIATLTDKGGLKEGAFYVSYPGEWPQNILTFNLSDISTEYFEYIPNNDYESSFGSTTSDLSFSVVVFEYDTHPNSIEFLSSDGNITFNIQ